MTVIESFDSSIDIQYKAMNSCYLLHFLGLLVTVVDRVLRKVVIALKVRDDDRENRLQKLTGSFAEMHVALRL